MVCICNKLDSDWGCVYNNQVLFVILFAGVPPLVSRRVLETLTYLARNHLYVAKILLQSRLSLPSLEGSVPSDKARGKAVVVSDDHMGRTQQEPGSVAFALLLSLLNQPLYLRSVAHLEQVLLFIRCYGLSLFSFYKN